MIHREHPGRGRIFRIIVSAKWFKSLIGKDFGGEEFKNSDTKRVKRD